MKLVAPTAWQCISTGEGAKEPRVYDRALVELAESISEERPQQSLLRCRFDHQIEIVAYRSFTPADIPLSEFIRVAGMR
jgi:hypothetical protein